MIDRKLVDDTLMKRIFFSGQLSSIFDESRSVMVKRCPFCGSFCERIEGCNQMQCVCGESFCYVCSKKWDGSAHYECTVDVFVVSIIDYLFFSMRKKIR